MHTHTHNQPVNTTPNIDPRSPTALFDTAIDENYVLGDSIYEKIHRHYDLSSKTLMDWAIKNRVSNTNSV